MRSEFSKWFEQYENKNEYAAKQIAKDAYEIGLQHRQTEVDELQKRVGAVIQQAKEFIQSCKDNAEIFESESDAGKAYGAEAVIELLEQALKGGES